MLDLQLNLNEKRLLEVFREVVAHGYGKIMIEIKTDAKCVVINENHTLSNQWTQPK